MEFAHGNVSFVLTGTYKTGPKVDQWILELPAVVVNTPGKGVCMCLLIHLETYKASRSFRYQSIVKNS